MKTRKLILLSIALVGYLAIGAEIFYRLEKNTPDIDINLENMYQYLQKKYNITASDITRLKVSFHERMDSCFAQPEWTYWSSLYFCGSVVTTIGYGHLAPRTPTGRLICIIYASFGIPLNLWLIKVLGEKIHLFISNAIQLFEEKALGREAKRLKIKGFIVAAFINFITLILGGVMYHYSEKWSLLDSIYFCFIVYSTIGFGDLVPNEGHAPVNNHEIAMMLLRALNLMLGLCLLSSLLASAMNAADDIRIAIPAFNLKVHPSKVERKANPQDLVTSKKDDNTDMVVEDISNEDVPQRELNEIGTKHTSPNYGSVKSSKTQ